MRVRTFVSTSLIACALAVACAGCQGGDPAASSGQQDSSQDAAQAEPAVGDPGSGSFEDVHTFDNQQNVTLNASFEGDGFTATLTDVEVLDEVQPANPSGYYVYMEQQDGMKYLVVNGEVTNTSSEAVTVGDGSMVSISNPALLYTGDAQALSGGTIWAAPADGSTLGSVELEPGASTPFKIITTVEDDQASDLDGYKVYFTVDAGFDSASFSTLGSDEIKSDAGGDFVFCLEL